MRIPAATYRIQFNSSFQFADATALAPLLDRLGITHIYASPLFAARSGSKHGYDVVDPNRLNPSLGTAGEFEELVQALRSRGMGLVLDIVPNHMAASAENEWWMDVLENGSASAYASYFGISWRERIFLPILGDHYGPVVERGELKLSWADRGFVVNYYDARMPIDPSTYAVLLGDEIDPELRDMLGRLPSREATEWESLDARNREKERIKRFIRQCVDPRMIEERLRLFNADVDQLHDLLERQVYRLAFWKAATERVNYRRFFDVADYVGIRIDDEAVFQAVHALVLSLVSEGKVDGLRIDHIDGLFDPAGYLNRLSSCGAYIVVEKILGDGEQLPVTWPVQGTTGYDFLAAVNGLAVDPAGFEKLGTLYAKVAPGVPALADVEYQRKKHVITELFEGEFQELGADLANLAELDRHARDLKPSELLQALREVTACLAVYRTYASTDGISRQDREFAVSACDLAQARNPSLSPLPFTFLRRVLTLEPHTPDRLRFVMRWQQMTGPVAAKGVEDSAYYVYNRLISLNEVGSWSRPVDVEEFHRLMQERQSRHPHTMNTTSTHDTKRSEGIRNRINVLSEIPDELGRLCNRWYRWQKDVTRIDPNDVYLIWQTLLGAYPLEPEELGDFRDRLRRYMIKAIREARVHSSWLNPDEFYEGEAMRYIDALLDSPRFFSSFLQLHERVAFYGAINSLAQTVLKVTCPGIPDFYQGTLRWNFTLVDPDNRRPVTVSELTDFPESGHKLLRTWRDGRVKTFVTETALAFRKAHLTTYQQGEYIPLEIRGRRTQNAIAFFRRFEDDWAMTIIPRFPAQLSVTTRPPTGIRAWSDTVVQLPADAPSEWRNVFTGRRVTANDRKLPLFRVFNQFPVAIFSGRTA